jgi:hypothetical protein
VEVSTAEEIPMPENRERINTGNDARFVRRDEKGRFKQSVDVGRSLAADRRKTATNASPRNQGDKGDQRKTR